MQGEIKEANNSQEDMVANVNLWEWGDKVGDIVWSYKDNGGNRQKELMVRIWASKKGKRQSKLRHHVHWKMSFLLSNRRLHKCEAILPKGQHSTPKYKGFLCASFLYLSLYSDGVTVCHSRLLLLEYGSFVSQWVIHLYLQIFLWSINK